MSARISLSAGAPEFTLEDAGIAEFEFGGDEHTTSPNSYASTRTVKGTLWEREAEREVTYYEANSYRYTNQLTLTRSILIGQAEALERMLGVEEARGPLAIDGHPRTSGVLKSNRRVK